VLRRSTRPLAIAAVILIAVVVAPEPPGGPPNVVLIVMDTARQDRLSCYGYPRETSPRLSELAESAAVYSNAYSTSSWTAPGHASLFTGLFPVAHGATQEDWDLDPDLTTIAEVLSDHGYRTIGIVENPMLTRDLGYAQGFSKYHEVWLPRTRPQPGSEALDRFVNTLDAASDGPIFVFVNLIEPHSPYNSSRQFRDRYLSDPAIPLEANEWREYYVGRRTFSDEEIRHLNELYDAELLFTDHVVGEMADALRERGLWERTLFVVTSDHGENIGDHDHMDHVFSLYETTTRVPLVIHHPPLFAPGSVVEAPVQLTDLFATILAVARVDAAPYPSHGRSLLSETGAGEREVLCEYYYPRQAIKGYRRLDDRTSPLLAPYRRQIRSLTAGGMKLVWGSDGANELYDLSADPDERVNLIDSAEHAETRLELTGRLGEVVEAYRRERADTTAVPDEELDDATREALRSLGYLE